MKSPLFYIVLLFSIASCGTDETPSADKIFYNGTIYTVDEANPMVEAFAVKADTICGIGSIEEMTKWKGELTSMIDLDGRFVMPGFIEGHGHFAGVGQSMVQLNVLNATSWQEITRQLKEKVESSTSKWITGRGWHQDKWTELPNSHTEGYPDSKTVDAFTSDRPVILKHASGHALFANQAAMDIAGVSVESPDPKGGRIVRDESGRPIGIFEETAMTIITEHYKSWYAALPAEKRRQLELEEIKEAEVECLSNGVTSFQDAGSKYHHLKLYRELSETDSMDVRLWVMFRDSLEALKKNIEAFPYIEEDNKFFTCRAIKSEIDGALGSYGAWLLEPYADKAGFNGQNTTDVDEVENIARLAKKHDMQLCVHAIGDKGNRVIIDMMERQMEDRGPELRWRIEHAQHLHPNDIPRFAELGIIASMQSVHCTSDAPFVEKRLGKKRAKEGAYVWKSLLKHGAVVSNGTDAPVEDVDPLANLYAAVTRKRTDNGMVFYKAQAISREEALYSMTMACAYAAFEEDIKGSISLGKLADFIVVDKNLVTCSEQDILEAKILSTYVGGVKKYTHAGEH